MQGIKTGFKYVQLRVSNVNLPLTVSATNGTNDPNHTKASSSTPVSSLNYQESTKINIPRIEH